jgi:hypothetical protein
MLMNNPPNTSNHTPQSEKQNKAYHIRQLKANNPQMKASDIAEKAGTSTSYVYNVLSKAKRSGEVVRRREDRLYGVAHGHFSYQDSIWTGWYDALNAPIVNAKTGMKQVGFKGKGDPCSCQIHKNGKVVVFTHALGWRGWLKEALMECGWDVIKASLLVDNLTIQVVLTEAGIKVADGFLPKDVVIQTAWGMVVIRDDSPTKNMLEVKLSVPDLHRYLGLPEIKNQLDLLTRGSMTANQLLRSVIALLLKKMEG